LRVLFLLHELYRRQTKVSVLPYNLKTLEAP
jgi:hypothetical protein